MPAASFEFHGSLEYFLSPQRRGRPLERSFYEPPAVKDAIEALGVPHPEVDLILVGGRRVDFGYRLTRGDRIDVFGVDRPASPAGDVGLVPPPPDPRRFVLDGHLGRLARYLRMLGFDTHYGRDAADDELARLSAAGDRILLTRDRGLLKRSAVRLGYLVRDDDPRRQLTEVVERYRLAPLTTPFSRCVRCNGDLRAAGRAEVADRLAGEPRTLRYFDQFRVCTRCEAIYWPGSHHARMSNLVREIVRGEPVIGDNRTGAEARTEEAR